MLLVAGIAEMGISPETADTGVGPREEEVLEDLSSPLNSDLVAGESCGARCDLRLCLSIMLTVHASRSTGVLFAACRKGSDSYNGSACTDISTTYVAYIELLRRWPLLGILHKTLCHNIFQYLRERITLWQFGCRLENDLL